MIGPDRRRAPSTREADRPACRQSPRPQSPRPQSPRPPTADPQPRIDRAIGAFTADDVTIAGQETAHAGYFRIDRFDLSHASHAGDTPVAITREVLQRPAAAAVLPYDPDRDRLVMIEQFRIGAFAAGQPPWMLETVAGMVEPGETPASTVRREAREEAGLDIIDLVPIYRYLPSPGGCSEVLHLFLGRVDSTGAGGVHGLAAEGEDIRVHVVPTADACSLLVAGHIRDAQSIIALNWLILNHSTLKRRWADPPKVRRRRR